MRTVSILAVFFCLLSLSCAKAEVEVASSAGLPYQANGIKIGEVDQTSAIIWMRTTRDETATPSIENAAPGTEGETCLIYWKAETPNAAVETDWAPTDPDLDFTRQVKIKNLEPGTTYEVRAESRPIGGGRIVSIVDGKFRTAPASDVAAPVEFVVVTGQAIGSVDSGDEGHSPYGLIPMLDPDFFVHTGDIVYYDKEPLCKDMETARWKWNRMYGYYLNRDFHAGLGTYFIKDDHDTLKNDCWPGQTYGDLTFEQGLGIFLEQVPMGEKTYRTRRWGEDVQVWMTENRDFRSPNRAPNGPEKTILGAEQKAWLFESMAASDATFRFLIMPGCLIGPDKPGKADNHSNACFQDEGDELREFLAGLDNVFVVNGDRHWQYWSVHPELGINEFGCGPINDQHNYGGDSGYQEEYHRYFSPKGGFLGVSVDRESGGPTATFRYYATSADAETPEIRFETTFEAE
jgi:alkaline phosphatase D